MRYKLSKNVMVDLGRVVPSRFVPTLEMDSGYKNKNIGFYSKASRPFLRILCVVYYSHLCM